MSVFDPTVTTVTTVTVRYDRYNALFSAGGAPLRAAGAKFFQVFASASRAPPRRAATVACVHVDIEADGADG